MVDHDIVGAGQRVLADHGTQGITGDTALDRVELLAFAQFRGGLTEVGELVLQRAVGGDLRLIAFLLLGDRRQLLALRRFHLIEQAVEVEPGTDTQRRNRSHGLSLLSTFVVCAARAPPQR